MIICTDSGRHMFQFSWTMRLFRYRSYFAAWYLTLLLLQRKNTIHWLSRNILFSRFNNQYKLVSVPGMLKYHSIQTNKIKILRHWRSSLPSTYVSLLIRHFYSWRFTISTHPFPVNDLSYFTLGYVFQHHPNYYNLWGSSTIVCTAYVV